MKRNNSHSAGEMIAEALLMLLTIGLLVLWCNKSNAQSWSLGLYPIDLTIYTSSDVEIKGPIDLYNWNRPSSGQLPKMEINKKNLFAPTVWGKYRLQDGESPLSVGAEVKFGKGLNFEIFSEVSFSLLDEGDLIISGEVRAGVGYSSSFPAKLDWGEFLTKNLPHLSVEQIEEGKKIFQAVSPSSLGAKLFISLTPQVIVEKEINSWLSINGSFGYRWDMISVLASRSQSGIIIAVGVSTNW